MIQHAMRYVEMSKLVRPELSDPLLEGQFLSVEEELVEAERGLVRAYGNFRELLGAAADAGNKRAAEYLRRTTWDLT